MNVNVVGTWDNNSLFIRKLTTYSFRSLKVRQTWTWTWSAPETTLSSFGNSLRTALDRWKWGQREHEWGWYGDKNSLFIRKLTTYSLKSLKVRQTWTWTWSAPETTLSSSRNSLRTALDHWKWGKHELGRHLRQLSLHSETHYVQLYIVESEANVNVNVVGTWDNNSLFIRKLTTYSFRSLKVRQTWTWTWSAPETTPSSFGNSLRTALDRWKWGKREREHGRHLRQLPLHLETHYVQL